VLIIIFYIHVIFSDFQASIVVLWDVMVVNNWFIFLYAYAKYTSK